MRGVYTCGARAKTPDARCNYHAHKSRHKDRQNYKRTRLVRANHRLRRRRHAFQGYRPRLEDPVAPAGDEATKCDAHPPLDQLGRASEQPKLRESRGARAYPSFRPPTCRLARPQRRWDERRLTRLPELREVAVHLSPSNR